MDRTTLVVALVGSLVGASACRRGEDEGTPVVRQTLVAPAVATGDWPAGPLRTGPVTIGLGLHRPPGQPPAQVATLVAKLVATHLPGLARVADLAADGASPAAWALKEFEEPGVADRHLEFFGRGLDARQRARLKALHPMTLISVRVPPGRADATLKGLLTVAEEAAKALDAVVEDPGARLYLGPAAVAEVLAEGFQGALPLVAHHAIIHQYREARGTMRSVTVGMGKLGLPNLVVNGHAKRAAMPMRSLLLATAQTLLEAGAVEQTGLLELDLRKLRARELREAQLASLVGKGTGRATLTLGVGKPEEGDDAGPLIELTFAGDGGSASERQEALLEHLYGGEDRLVRVRHDEALDAASRAARARLLALKPRWKAGLKPGEVLMVKGPFRTASGGIEWMWVEVTAWKGTTLHGLLANDPDDVPELKSGAPVTVEEAKAFDYLLELPDGSSEGNQTGKLLLEQGE